MSDKPPDDETGYQPYIREESSAYEPRSIDDPRYNLSSGPFFSGRGIISGLTSNVVNTVLAYGCFTVLVVGIPLWAVMCGHR